MGGAVDKVNGIQETGSSPCAIIKARSGPQLMLLHSGPRFFFVNRGCFKQMMAIIPISNGSIPLFHSSPEMKLSFQSLGTGVVLIEGNIWMGSLLRWR